MAAARSSAGESEAGSVGVAADEFGADAGEFVPDGAGFDDVDHRAPAGEVAGDVQRCRSGEANPYPPVVGFPVDAAVPSEPVAQDRHEPLLDEHRRPGARPSLFDLVDDLLPGGGEGEVAG